MPYTIIFCCIQEATNDGIFGIVLSLTVPDNAVKLGESGLKLADKFDSRSSATAFSTVFSASLTTGSS